MANTDNAIGFVPTPLGRVRNFSVDASNGTAFFIGDVTMRETDGNVAPASAGSALLVGVSLVPLAASTAGDGKVASDPHQEYVVQSAGTPAQANVGDYADHVAGAGSTVTNLSGHELSGTMAATLTGFLILDFVDRIDNEVDTNADLLVQMYDHIWGKTGA